MKKKIVIVACVAVLTAGLCGGIAYGANRSDTLLLKDNQRYVYAYITSIQGNEVTYMEVEESVVTGMLEENTENEDAASEENRQNVGERESNTEQGSAMPDMGNMPDMGEMPDMGSMPDMGEMPDMGNMPDMGSMPDMGEMPDMGSMPDMGEMPDMGNMPDMSNMQGDAGRADREQGFTRGEGEDREHTKEPSSERENMQFGTMTETVTTYIPVGVPVHTASDVTTTFSRLASGDLIKILVETNDAETDVIEEIWMLQ